MSEQRGIREDLQAGVTVALVTIPQCMAFALIAGLPPVAGLYTAVVMGLVTALISGVPKLNTGPAVTISSMVFAVLVSVAPHDHASWWAIASLLALLVGLLTLAAAFLHVGQFVRFVSRSVLVGLTAGVALLILGSQLAPFLGLATVRAATLIEIVLQTAGRLHQLSPTAVLVSSATLLFVLIAARFGPRFPGAFLAMIFGGLIAWLLELAGAARFETIGEIPRVWPRLTVPLYEGAYATDLLVGAAAIALVGIIQTLTVAKTLTDGPAGSIDAKRELTALSVANLAAGVVQGFPGAGSFTRSGLNEMAGGKTRLSGIAAAVATAGIVAFAAPYATHIKLPVIAGLLVATAISIVEWRELIHILSRDRHDRIVLLTTVICVFVLPIHWAILIGLSVSIAIFLRRVSQLHLFEMVAGGAGVFHERAIDDSTGGSTITMLQVEGPLFFAHADEITAILSDVMGRRPRVVILRMRRTQQIDFSVVTAMSRVAADYLACGGALIICGLTPEMRRVLRDSPLGETLPREHLLVTTGEVFGSAHEAIDRATNLAGGTVSDGQTLFRTA